MWPEDGPTSYEFEKWYKKANFSEFGVGIVLRSDLDYNTKMPALDLEWTVNHFDLRGTKISSVFYSKSSPSSSAYLQLMLEIDIILLEINYFGINFSPPLMRKQTSLVGEQ